MESRRVPCVCRQCTSVSVCAVGHAFAFALTQGRVRPVLEAARKHQGGLWPFALLKIIGSEALQISRRVLDQARFQAGSPERRCTIKVSTKYLKSVCFLAYFERISCQALLNIKSLIFPCRSTGQAPVHGARADTRQPRQGTANAS